MKILDKTIFRGKNKEIKVLAEKLKNNTFLLDELLCETREKGMVINNLNQQLDELNKMAADSISKVMMENTRLKDQLAQKEKLRRKNASAMGGLKKEINKLNKEKELLKEQYDALKSEFDEFRDGKYVVRVIKPGRTPKGQKIGLKSGEITSRIISKVKPNEEAELNDR